MQVAISKKIENIFIYFFYLKLYIENCILCNGRSTVS